MQSEARLAAAGDALRRIATRYLGERDGAAYARRTGDDTLIRLAAAGRIVGQLGLTRP